MTTREQRRTFVEHACLKCGAPRSVSLWTVKLIERGKVTGRCSRCCAIERHAAGRGGGRRGVEILTPEEIQEWARETWAAMSDRDRAVLSELYSVPTCRRSGRVAA